MAGFFGKLPASGDFMARGLGAGVRPALDRWLTLGPARLLGPGDWPEGGLRALLDGPSGPLALVIVPSRDTSGRAFPLAACAEGSAAPAAIDAWSESILPALLAAAEGRETAESLAATLAATGPAQAEGPGQGAAPPLVWTRDHPPGPPEAVLSALAGAL